MKKVVRLTEDQFISLVKKVISESEENYIRNGVDPNKFLELAVDKFNEKYLATKEKKLGHARGGE